MVPHGSNCHRGSVGGTQKPDSWSAVIEAGPGNGDNGFPMVTLAERISEPEPRRSRRLPGSPCVAAAQETTAVKSVHGNCFTAPCPQGSTGTPACEIKYLRAATHTQSWSAEACPGRAGRFRHPCLPDVWLLPHRGFRHPCLNGERSGQHSAVRESALCASPAAKCTSRMVQVIS